MHGSCFTRKASRIESNEMDRATDLGLYEQAVDSCIGSVTIMLEGVAITGGEIPDDYSIKRNFI